MLNFKLTRYYVILVQSQRTQLSACSLQYESHGYLRMGVHWRGVSVQTLRQIAMSTSEA